ncbi:hypothetical protein L596_022477 [Steinernema carpocapsae]|nr:hypothetical protein L596_022477 [Steinernema carpocapsae]
MAYIDPGGNIVRSRNSIVKLFWKIIAFIIFFFQTLLHPFIQVSDEEMRYYGHGRRNGRRNEARLNTGYYDGMSCHPGG